jgi:homoserine dehydrogenase
MVETLEPASYSVLGDSGNVGGALVQMAAKPEVAARHGLRSRPDMVGGRAGWWEHGRQGDPVAPVTELPDSDVLFITTPSTGDDEPMYGLISGQLERGRTVVTAEKRTVANHLEEFRQYPGQLLTWACVGGGAMMAPVLKYYTMDPDNVRELALGTNGTLAAMFDRFASGDSEKGITDYILDRKLAEPGNTDLFGIAGAEADKDVPAKFLILAKMLFPGRFDDLTLADIQSRLTDDEFSRATGQAYFRRHLIDIFPEDAEDEAARVDEEKVGGFEPIHHGGFIAVGGFLNLHSTRTLRQFYSVPDGPTAAFRIRLGPADGSTEDGIYGGHGDGAGPDPTASAMLQNYLYHRLGVTLL